MKLPAGVIAVPKNLLRFIPNSPSAKATARHFERQHPAVKESVEGLRGIHEQKIANSMFFPKSELALSRSFGKLSERVPGFFGELIKAIRVVKSSSPKTGIIKKQTGTKEITDVLRIETDIWKPVKLKTGYLDEKSTVFLKPKISTKSKKQVPSVNNGFVDMELRGKITLNPRTFPNFTVPNSPSAKATARHLEVRHPGVKGSVEKLRGIHKEEIDKVKGMSGSVIKAAEEAERALPRLAAVTGENVIASRTLVDRETGEVAEMTARAMVHSLPKRAGKPKSVITA